MDSIKKTLLVFIMILTAPLWILGLFILFTEKKEK